jgi:DNA-binding MarR family transcriptional regulator
MLTDKSNITRLIKGMETDGLVTRRQHETDGRAVSLFLTDSGKQTLADANAAHVNFTQERFSSLSMPTNCLMNELLVVKRVFEAQ